MSKATVADQPVQSFIYDAVGNMLSKTGVGTGNYVYPVPGSARPHAVKSIPGIGDFEYDANGNLLSGAGRTVSWTSFDMPRTIAKGGESSTFMYGPEHQRARQERSDGTTTYYAGPMEVEIHNGATKIKTYWPMGLGVEIDQPAGATELNWTHLDRLGSVVAISDANGVLKEKLAYDSWGKRRTLNGEAIPDELDGVTDNRGFTGHEMLDRLDLVHMNGRVYDPLVARFMSADPLIQDPEHSQSYNRYTYVWNNPTNLTDPTGFAGEETEDNRSRQLQEDEERRNRNSNPTDRAVQASGTVTDNSKTTASNDPSTTKGAAAKPADSGVSPTLTMSDVGSYGLGRLQGIGTGAWNLVTEDVPNAASAALHFVKSPLDSLSNFHPIDGLVDGGHAMQDWARSYFETARSGEWQKAGQMQGEFEGKAAVAAAVGAGTGPAIGLAKTQVGRGLFLSERFGVTSDLLGHSASGVKGSLNQPGNWFKMGWSGTPDYGGGMYLRVGLFTGSNSNHARFHFGVWGSFVPDSYANGSLAVKQSLRKLESR